MRLTDILHLLDGFIDGRRLTALTGGTYVLDSIVVTNPGSGFASAPTVGFSGGGGSGAAATAVLLNNSVIQVVITNPGSGYTSAPTVTFTGGTPATNAAANAVLEAGSLDAIVTGGVSLTPILIAAMFLSGKFSFYRLRAGTDAANSPYIIRPVDYNGATNQKVWELVVLDERASQSNGAVAITNGTSGGTVSGLALPFTPSTVLLTVEMPNSSGLVLTAALVGDPTSGGFVYALSGVTDASGYKLHYLALA